MKYVLSSSVILLILIIHLSQLLNVTNVFATECIALSVECTVICGIVFILFVLNVAFLHTPKNGDC